MTEVLWEISGKSRHTRLVPSSSIQRFPSNSCVRLVLHTKFHRWEACWTSCPKATYFTELSSHSVPHGPVLPAEWLSNIFTIDFCQNLVRRQWNNADLEDISRYSRVVILELPELEYCYILTAIRTQLVESWLLAMLPCNSWGQGRTVPHPDCL